MPAWQDILDDGQIDDIIAYLKRALAGSGESHATAPAVTTYPPAGAPYWRPLSP